MHCDGVKELLSAFLDGELTDRESAEVRAHLEDCASCREEIEALRETVSAVQALGKVAAPEGFRAQVMNRVRVENGEQEPRRVSLWRMVWPAAAALLVGSFIWIFGSDDVRQPMRASAVDTSGELIAYAKDTSKPAPAPEGLTMYNVRDNTAEFGTPAKMPAEYMSNASTDHTDKFGTQWPKAPAPVYGKGGGSFAKGGPVSGDAAAQQLMETPTQTAEINAPAAIIKPEDADQGIAKEREDGQREVARLRKTGRDAMPMQRARNVPSIISERHVAADEIIVTVANSDPMSTMSRTQTMLISNGWAMPPDQAPLDSQQMVLSNTLRAQVPTAQLSSLRQELNRLAAVDARDASASAPVVAAQQQARMLAKGDAPEAETSKSLSFKKAEARQEGRQMPDREAQDKMEAKAVAGELKLVTIQMVFVDINRSGQQAPLDATQPLAPVPAKGK